MKRREANKQICKQTNTQTNKQTNKRINNSKIKSTENQTKLTK